MKEKIDFVKNYIFGKVIKTFMVEDLKSMLGIDPNKEGACNFPIALYTLSCIDYLGYLIADKTYSRYGRDTDKRIRDYINMTFDEIDKESLVLYLEKLVDQFRHGLAHEYFPKLAGISRITSKVVVLDKDMVILNADIFANMFLKSLQNLESLLDDNFCLKIHDRYNSIYNDNVKEHGDKQVLNTGDYSYAGYTGPSKPPEGTE